MRLNLSKSPLLLIAALSSVSMLFTDDRAIAQVAEVPNPDSNGNFMTVFQRGNRGFYAIEKWLVVQPAESGDYGYGLNCRYSPNGEIRSRILRGAILTAAFKGSGNRRTPNAPERADDAIVLDDNGSPWLRVKGLRDELAEPVKPTTWEQLGECYVRANLKYIAPINPDSIYSLKEPKTDRYCQDKSLACLPAVSKWLSLS